MSWRWFVVWSIGLWVACGGGGFEGLHFPSTGRTPGSRAFVSADDSLSPPWPLVAGRQRRSTVYSQDSLYRPLPDGRLLRWSHEKGLEIIDVSNPTLPSVLGRLFVWGLPVDVSVIGETAHLLLDCASCYLTGADGKTVEMQSTAWLITVDLSDPTRPREVDRRALPGKVLGSLLTRVDGVDVLQVGTYRWLEARQGDEALLWAFALSPEGSREIGTRVLSTGRPLLVGGGAWLSFEEKEGHVTLRALSLEHEGAPLELAGRWRHAHVADDFLYAVSWKSPDHVLEVFDVSDPHHPRAVSKATFDEAHSVLFQDGAVFVVTRDSIRVFTVSKMGAIAEATHLVPPEHQAFRTALFLAGGTRLLAFASSHAELVVRVYDVSEPERGMALLGEAGGLWNTNQTTSGWNLERLALLGEGTPDEPGLILLPFGAVYDGGERHDGVHLLSWSDEGIHIHGVLETEDYPRHLSVGHGLGFVESSGRLLVFDPSDPDRPSHLGSMGVGGWVQDVIALGDHRVEVTWSPLGHDISDLVVWDSDTSAELARREIPRESELRSLGENRLAVVHTTWQHVRIQVFELQGRGLKPRGELVLEKFGKSLDGTATGPWGDDHLLAVGGTLVFVSERVDTEVVGEETFCTEWPRHSNECLDGTTDPGCTNAGYRECVTRGDTTRCEGGFARCDPDGSCVETRDIDVDVNCGPREVTRTSREIEIRLVDMEDPDRPVLREIVRLPVGEEAAGWLVDGAGLWISSKKRLSPHVLDTPEVRFYTRRIDLSSPAAPLVGPPISLPGEVVAVEGSRLIARDRSWKALLLEEALAILHIEGDHALLETHRPLPLAVVESVHPDGRGRLAVGLTSFEDGVWEGQRKLIWLEADTLTSLDQVELAEWAHLDAATDGKALIDVPHGVVVYDLEAGATPAAFFPIPQERIRFRRAGPVLLFPASPYGIHSFAPGTAGLPQAPRVW